MSCGEHREAIALLAGGDLALSERLSVEAHLRQCAACRRLLGEFQAGRRLLAADPAVILLERVPQRVRPGRRPWAAAAAAVILAGALAFPQVRLAVAEVLHLPLATVREKVTTWRLPGGGGRVTEYVDADYLGTEFLVDPGPGVKRAYVQTPEAARALVGRSLFLPPAAGPMPPGTLGCMDAIRVEYVTDPQGLLTYATLEACAFTVPPGEANWAPGAAWYEAQYWPGRPADKLNLLFGANWQVSSKDETIGGRPARVIEATNRVTGDYHSEVWLTDGEWLYKIRNHNPAIGIEKLVAVANALR
ncbi:MAG: hypothetical protein K0R39_2586 [Symbiobacteriaceae bacterium]|jgi:hypothetical protein|nr:hypothetical protein [Symbiobacteriaceae bacterium]